jgi:SHS2 domain-containing protein
MPVADHGEVARLPELDRAGRRGSAERVVEVPDAVAEDADAVSAVAVPVAHHGDVTGLAPVVEAVDVRIEGDEVRGTVRGEPHDSARHTLHTEIKAITYHHLSIEEDAAGGWRTLVIVDV